MRYYILNYEVKASNKSGEYYHVNICNEKLEEFHTYVYPQYNSKKIHNASLWMDVLTSKHGIVLTGLKAKADAPDRNGSTLINADSIRKAEVDQVFDTTVEMYDHIAKLMEDNQYTTSDNGLWEF